MSGGKIILITVLAGVIGTGAALVSQKWFAEWQGTASIISPGHGKRINSLPDFRLPDVSGRMHASNSWAGKVLVLNFWATWCPPCLREMPLFIELQQEYAGRSVQFVAIAIDELNAVKEFAAAHEVNFPLLLGTLETVALSRDLGNRLEGLPFTVIFDHFGKVVYARAGEVTRTALEKHLQPLVEPRS